ncbi:MAG: cyclically-permuted mutarotase family protein [Bacteroidales bacterium]|nr:cyclically-permuted mutarotase family protein [Bacteroidales bacterium]
MRRLLLLAVIAVLLNACSYNEPFRNNIRWEELTELPPAPGMDVQYGLAGHFAGASGDVIIVAGGANFPDKPVQDGGKKVYHDDIFVLRNDGPGNYIWESGFSLDEGLAYGVTVPWNDGILCIGGRNSCGPSSGVFHLSWDKVENKIRQVDYPDLPFGIYDMGGDIADGVIYLAGGYIEGKATSSFLKLDLNSAEIPELKWEVLDDFPGPARIQPVLISQNAAEEKHLYLVSGSSHPGGSDPIILTDCLEYNPKTGLWTNRGPIAAEGGEPYSLHGAAGIGLGVQHIMFIGGVNKEVFNRALERERELEKAINEGNESLISRLQQEKYEYLTMNPADYKFNSDVLVYHTITSTWSVVGEYPYPPTAGAAMVKMGDRWFIISGEIKPGVRTPGVYSGYFDNRPSLGVVNWMVIIVYLIGMLLLGYFFMRREKGTDDFFKAGGRVPWWVAGVSIFATMLSAITFMSIPAKTYATNWLYFPMAVTIFIMAWPVVRYYLPFFRRLNVTTAYEYLERRFNYGARALASVLFLIFMTARMALVLFLPSLALTAVTGISIYTCIILMGVVTVIYCTMGGVEAVVWGDFIQGIVLFGGSIIAVIFMVSGTEGGLSAVIDITVEESKMKTFDLAFNLTRATFWVVLLGGLANNLISYSADQAVIQRYLTTSNERQAAKSIWMNGVLSIIVSFIFYFIGTALFAYFRTHPLELNMAMENPDSIFPHFIMARLPVGIAGLLIAAIFSATMSTVSSNINSISTAFITDFYKKLFPGRSDRTNLLMARIAGIVAGALGVVFALLMATWNILSLFDFFNVILGLLASGLAGLFAMGIFFKSISSIGAISGFVLGTITLFVIRDTTDLHFLLYGFIGILTTVIIALIISIIFRNKKDIYRLTYRTINK